MFLALILVIVIAINVNLAFAWSLVRPKRETRAQALTVNILPRFLETDRQLRARMTRAYAMNLTRSAKQCLRDIHGVHKVVDDFPISTRGVDLHLRWWARRSTVLADAREILPSRIVIRLYGGIRA